MVALLSLLVMSVEAVTLWKVEGWLWITKPPSWTPSLPAPFQGPVLGNTTPILMLTQSTLTTRLHWRKRCSMTTWISFGMVCVSSPRNTAGSLLPFWCICVWVVLSDTCLPVRVLCITLRLSRGLVWNTLCSRVPAEPPLWLLRKNIVLRFWFLFAWGFLQTSPLSTTCSCRDTALGPSRLHGWNASLNSLLLLSVWLHLSAATHQLYSFAVHWWVTVL